MSRSYAMAAGVGPNIQMDTKAVLIFDGDCGFCTRTAHAVTRLNVRRRFEVLPYQTGGLLERVGLTEQQCQEAAWFVEPDGRRRRGAAAINAALHALGGAWRAVAWLYRVPGITQAEDRLYGWIARNRYRLPGSAEACHVADKRPTPGDRV